MTSLTSMLPIPLKIFNKLKKFISLQLSMQSGWGFHLLVQKIICIFIKQSNLITRKFALVRMREYATFKNVNIQFSFSSINYISVNSIYIYIIQIQTICRSRGIHKKLIEARIPPKIKICFSTLCKQRYRQQLFALIRKNGATFPGVWKAVLTFNPEFQMSELELQISVIEGYLRYLKF